VVPEKQGLKLWNWVDRFPDIMSISGGSRKTRIETRTGINPGNNWSGISGGSRKTRIETYGLLRVRPFRLGISGGSRKTRIETGKVLTKLGLKNQV